MLIAYFSRTLKFFDYYHYYYYYYLVLYYRFYNEIACLKKKIRGLHA